MNQPNSSPVACGTDFSEPARQAADFAAMLAKRAGTRLLLLHGIDERAEMPPNYWNRLMEEDRPRLHDEAERLRASGATVEEVLAGATPGDGVAKCAEAAGARVIVLASSGMGALGRMLMGSVSERIAETARVPALVVRDAAVLQAWLRGGRALKVFVGADFTPVSDAALQWVSELRHIAPCEITLGFVDRAPEERAEMAIFDALNLAVETEEALAGSEHDLRTKAEHWLGVQPVMVRVTPGSARIDAHLLHLADEAHADLIVIGTHQWRGVNRLRHSSVSRRVLHDAKVNVACVPARRVNAGIPDVRRVLAATDLSATGDLAVPHACSLLESGGAVRLVHVIAPGEPREPGLARLRGLIPSEAAGRGIQTEVDVIEGRDVAAAICEAADRFAADVVCIGSHGRSGFLPGALGSVAHAVLAKCSRPVLAVRAPGT